MVHPRIDRLVFRVGDLQRTKAFYESLLGPPLTNSGESVTFGAGEINLLFATAPPPHVYPWDNEQLGIDHLAFPVASSYDLVTKAVQISEAGLQHSGIQVAERTGNSFFWLSDPDGLRIEFYCEAE